MRLYDLTHEYLTLLEHAEDGEDISERLEIIEDSISQKGEAIARVLRNLTGDVDSLDSEIKRLTHRRKCLENNVERLRDHLRRAMFQADIKRIKTATFSISVGEGPEHVEVVDEKLLPDEYVRIKREVSKSAILAAYKTTGEIPPGSRIERSPRLTIR